MGLPNSLLDWQGGKGALIHAWSSPDTVLFQGRGTTGKFCCVSLTCPEPISFPRKLRAAELYAALAGVCRLYQLHKENGGKHPVFPRDRDSSGQHVTAMPNLKNNIGMTFLKIVIHTLTGYYKLTCLVFPKKNK